MIKQIIFLTLIATSPLLAEKTCTFEKSRIGAVVYEAACVFDVDKDGNLDIVSGEYWFAGPNFKIQHKICTVMPKDQYYDDFCDYPMDVNGDGYIDIITGGWWGKTLQWRENPKGKPVLWKIHDVDQCGNIETIRFWDVDGDGHVEAVPNAGGKVAVYQLLRDANGKGTGKFKKFVVKDSDCGHGLGFGDINGDGRGDFIIPNGWIEAPKKPLEQKWQYHSDFNVGHASVPVLVHDVNEDGLNDLIVGMAHNYGLHWWQQKHQNGKRTFTKHEIDAKRSQYHDLALIDIDKDGKLELITGKRYRAHNGNDPGSADPVGIYYFNINGGKFERVTLDYGPPETHSGAGIYFWTADLDNNGYLDVVAPGKEGLYLFKNQGLKSIWSRPVSGLSCRLLATGEKWQDEFTSRTEPTRTEPTILVQLKNVAEREITIHTYDSAWIPIAIYLDGQECDPCCVHGDGGDELIVLKPGKTWSFVLNQHYSPFFGANKGLHKIYIIYTETQILAGVSYWEGKLTSPEIEFVFP